MGDKDCQLEFLHNGEGLFLVAIYLEGSIV